jgi:hypothetical protein
LCLRAACGGRIKEIFMTMSTVPTNARVVKYQNKFFLEFIRKNRFAKYIGTDEGSPIQIVEDLTKGRGEKIRIYLVNDMAATTANGRIRTGYQTLKGYETPMDTRSNELTVGLSRFAITIFESDKQFSAIDLVEARDAVLQDQFKVYFRDRIITALGSLSIDGTTHYAYADADETTIKDVWVANNSDRILFGNAQGSFTDHSADIGQLDTTNDIVNETNLKLWKDKAKAASPIIRPIKVREDEEWYLVFLGTKLFRQAQTALATLNREAWVRAQGENNPLFTGGDLIFDGMIIKEIPEIGSLAGTPGASGTTSVAPGYLVGAQALGYAVAQRSKLIEDKDDYDEVNGAGIKMLDQVAKLYFGSGAADTTTPKQHGVVTGYFAHA